MGDAGVAGAAALTRRGRRTGRLGGTIKQPPPEKAPPHWSRNISTPDVDATTRAGAVARCDRPGEPTPIPNVVPFPRSPIPRELRSRPLRRRARRPSRKDLCRPASSPGTN